MQFKHNSDNVDPDEINKFNNLASGWWDLEGEFKALHQINPLRLNYINIHTDLVNKKVLDVGCGGGILCEGMSFRGADVTGVDMSTDALNVARDHAQKSNLNINYMQSTIEDMATEKKVEYDIITCLEMLEHVPQPASIIQSCFELLKPGGSIYLSTINRNIASYLGAIVAAEYVLNLLPKGTHEYKKFLKPREIHQYMRQAGFTVTGITGLTYNPFTKEYKLNEHNTSINYIVRGVKEL